MAVMVGWGSMKMPVSAVLTAEAERADCPVLPKGREEVLLYLVGLLGYVGERDEAWREWVAEKMAELARTGLV